VTTFYCGPSATGTYQDGRDFDNLLALPNTTGFGRGNTYVLVDGSYGSRTLSTVASGDTQITIRKAYDGDSGVSGYSGSLHDGQAIFTSIIDHTPYWIVNGITRTETTRIEAPAGYGIRITGSIEANSGNGNNASYSEFSYLDIGGTWSEAGWSSAVCIMDSEALRLVYNQNNITFTRCVFHNSGHNGALAMVHGSSYITWDRCDFYFGWGKATLASPNVNCSYWTVKYCRFWNASQYDQCADIEGAGLTCEIGSYADDLTPTGHEMYGNIFYHTGSDSGRNASIAFAGMGFVNTNAYNCKVYNNTFVIPESCSSALINLYGGSGNIVRNNLFYNCGSTSIVANTSSNNATAGSDPFVDYANRDFRLSGPTTGGYSLSSPYDVDPAGVTRGVDGTWDLGAYEYGGGGSASLSPSKSPSLSPSASVSPSKSPSLSPSASVSPSRSPSNSPSQSPSKSPSKSPSLSPSISPSASRSPSKSPSASPSASPSEYSPSLSPSASPSVSPSTGTEYPKFILSESPYIVTEQQTTDLLTPPAEKTGVNFDFGIISDVNNPCSNSITINVNGYTEVEWCIKATENAVPGEIYEFRVTRS
jgi:hypothetical protein